MSEEIVQNDQLILISGESGTGKSASLRNIRHKPNWLYLNTEAGKRLPFRNDFQSFRIEDVYNIPEAFTHGTGNDDVHGIIIDTATFMFDMLETQVVLSATNTQAAWAEYAQFWKRLMHQYVVAFAKPVIILAHTKADLDETNHEMRVAVPVKGALKNNGIEAYFSTVVSTKKVTLRDLEDYKSDLLHITDDDELVGYKHVFQTRLTKKTVGERIRSPMGLFTREQTFIDNDAQALLDHLHDFYK